MANSGCEPQSANTNESIGQHVQVIKQNINIKLRKDVYLREKGRGWNIGRASEGFKSIGT